MRCVVESQEHRLPGPVCLPQASLHGAGPASKLPGIKRHPVHAWNLISVICWHYQQKRIAVFNQSTQVQTWGDVELVDLTPATATVRISQILLPTLESSVNG